MLPPVAVRAAPAPEHGEKSSNQVDDYPMMPGLSAWLSSSLGRQLLI